VRAWAWGVFGPEWEPSHRHFLTAKDDEDRCRHTGERPPAAATVYTVKNAEGRQRHFTVEDGRVVEHASWEAGFGDMLLEPHPTRGFEHQGTWCGIHRHSPCWAPFELNRPRSPEQLAALRVSRERGKAERAEAKGRADAPLFTVWAERLQAEEEQERER
jgi:hypothetical protein